MGEFDSPDNWILAKIKMIDIRCIADDLCITNVNVVTCFTADWCIGKNAAQKLKNYFFLVTHS
jgi:hypothetical protein